MSRRSAIAILFIGALLFPFPTTVVPEWKLKVKDYSGNLLVGEPVREIWQHSSLEFNVNEEELITDENGEVVFPERRIWLPVLGRIVFTSWAFLKFIAHSGEPLGVHKAWVIVPNNANEGGFTVYRPDAPLPQQINVRR